MERRFDVPVRIAIGNVLYDVANARQAIDLLINKWPSRRGPKYHEARKLCVATLERKRSMTMARLAFLDAAREAGILVG
ncbi:DUF982 domain-containing protein [Pseudaminobacter sp. NGMCC 1.201702]|uniref:DUF982 domain-containing protein n=1 Tax=Pseudaminobacter sp. NGMCC 1.201702 TaxID=3391825 RepID=UPI0039EF7BC1